MKRIAVLGSTGSIGQNTLAIAKVLSGQFRVVALSANSNAGLLTRQAGVFRPDLVCIGDTRAWEASKGKFPRATKVVKGAEGLLQICEDKRIDLVVVAITGSHALTPLVCAIENGKDIALANKEALVMAGPLLMRKARARGVRIMPIDSEQSAIWQCLHGNERSALKTVYLTASGGPFRTFSKSALKKICVQQALMHPRWKMGRKITVDSATLMNKGLEVLEAMYLFGLGWDKIKILIHPESIIHSMVEYQDGSILAQLSVTDMRIPIQYALTYPKRFENAIARVNFLSLRSLSFQRPDFNRFPCLSLAYQAARQSGTAPCVLNAANEVAVEAFLEGRLSFMSIPMVIKKVLRAHRRTQEPALKDIIAANIWAKAQARKVIGNG